MITLIALVPVLSVFLFLVILQMPAIKGMPASLLLTGLLAVLAWRVPLVHVLAASMEGVIIALTILWIPKIEPVS